MTRITGPAAILISPVGTPTPKGFKPAEDGCPKIAPLPKAAKLFGMTRRALYSILFNERHVTPEGVLIRFRGRWLVDLARLENFLRGNLDAKT